MKLQQYVRLLRDTYIATRTFVLMQDEKVIEKRVVSHWSDHPDSIARVFDELAGFDVVGNAMFDYGIVHPEKVGAGTSGGRK